MAPTLSAAFSPVGHTENKRMEEWTVLKKWCRQRESRQCGQAIRWLGRRTLVSRFELHMGHFTSFSSSVFEFVPINLDKRHPGCIHFLCHSTILMCLSRFSQRFKSHHSTFSCNGQILWNFNASKNILIPYLTHSCHAISSLISLAHPFPTFPLTHSQPSILRLSDLLFQFPSLINSNFFPSYSSFSSYGWRSITKSTQPHPPRIVQHVWRSDSGGMTPTHSWGEAVPSK